MPVEMVRVRRDRFMLDNSNSTEIPIERSFPFNTHNLLPAGSGGLSVLFLRVNPIEIRLSLTDLTVEINGEEIMKQIFNTDPERSWHESFTEGIREGANNLTIRIGPPVSAPVRRLIEVAEIVIFYRAQNP
jgi:hypothetical protein